MGEIIVAKGSGEVPTVDVVREVRNKKSPEGRRPTGDVDGEEEC